MTPAAFIESCPRDQWQEAMQALTLPGASSSQPMVFAAAENISASPEKPSVPLKKK
jgi:hypothetical protein